MHDGLNQVKAPENVNLKTKSERTNKHFNSNAFRDAQNQGHGYNEHKILISNDGYSSQEE